MRKLLVPVLLLATAALTSCKVLPIINQLQPLHLDGQQYDNIPIYTYRHQSRNILNNIFCKRTFSFQTNNPLLKICDSFRVKQGMVGESPDEIVNKKYDYNGDEFRQEQWHNYPRQLDRLHRYLYEYDAEKNVSLDPDDPAPDADDVDYRLGTAKTNEYQDSNDDNDLKPRDDETDLILLKMYSNNEPKLNLCSNFDKILLHKECKEYMDGNQLITQINKFNPAYNFKVKRQEASNSQDYENDIMDKERTVKKRIFSLWSRLQGMSHKGHELPHRRHIHAFYGLPDAGGSGALTAETRDGLRRPPGAPLRWG